MSSPVREKSRWTAAGAGTAGGGLHADTVPFPFGAKVGRIEAFGVALLQRMGEHGRAERRGVDRVRTTGAALQPVEQGRVGRGETVPDLLHFVGFAAAEAGERRLGEAGGDADAERTGDQFQKGEAPALVEKIEPARRECAGSLSGPRPRSVSTTSASPGGGAFGRTGGAGHISATVSERSPT